MKEGLYLCKVKGLKYCDYALLEWDGEFWWQYTRHFIDNIEGWVGNDLEIVEIINKID